MASDLPAAVTDIIRLRLCSVLDIETLLPLRSQAGVSDRATRRAYLRYVVRLIAFLLIVVAIVMKNVGSDAGHDTAD